MDNESFGDLYTAAWERYDKASFIQLQNLRCLWHTRKPLELGKYRYDVNFWSRYYAADDLYHKKFAKQLGFRGVGDPCSWPSRQPGTRVLGNSGQVIYEAVGNEARPEATQRARVAKGRILAGYGKNR